MVQHLRRGKDGPLAPGMPPTLTRVLAVVGDTTRLDFTSLHLQGYQVTRCTDPAAAVAELQGLNFHVVMVDVYAQYPGGRSAGIELLKWAIGQPHLCAYGMDIEGFTYGPLEVEDLNKFMNPIYPAESNGQKSPQITPNGLYNSSPSTTMPIMKDSPFPGRRARRNNKNHVHDTHSQDVERDGEHTEMEQEQPSQKPKKDRVVWTEELHKKFEEVYDKLVTSGDAVPKKILALMGDSRLTRENIASHLQKHRLNLQREACKNRLRRNHSRTRHHRSTPQASCTSPNMPWQRAAPTVMQCQSATVYANTLSIHFEALNTTDKSNKSVPVDVPPKDMYPGDDDPKQDSASCVVGNSDDNCPQEYGISVILNKEPEPSWDEEFLSNGD